MQDIARFMQPYLDRFVNSFVIQTDGHSVLVDTGLYRNRERVFAACQGEMLVLCTHGHFDHIGGHRFLQRKGARVLAHEGDLGYYTDHIWQWRQLYGQFERDFDIPQVREKTFWEEVGEPLNPDGGLEEGQTLEVDGVQIRVLHTPGHTPGSVCLYLPKEGMIFTGDTLMGRGFFGGMPQYCDRGAYLSSMERLSRLDVERVYCDHSDVAPGHALRERAEMAMEYALRLDSLVRDFFHCCKRPGEARLHHVCAFVADCEGKGEGSGTCFTVLAHLRALAGEFPEAGRIATAYDF